MHCHWFSVGSTFCPNTHVLINIEVAKRCTIYEHRPVTCREHPFNVTLSETGAVERLSISRIVPCPYELDGKQTLRGIKSAVYWNHRQSEYYHEKIRTWNRRREGRRTPREFLRFLGLTD